MTVKIYGPTASRAARALWAVNELGVPFEHVPIEMKDIKNPEFLAINPNGKVPAMVDGGLTLFESMAINLYLAKKYGSGGAAPLYPNTAPGEAEVWRWTLWAQGHLEPWVQRDAFMADIRRSRCRPYPNRITAVALEAESGALSENLAYRRPLQRGRPECRRDSVAIPNPGHRHGRTAQDPGLARPVLRATCSRGRATALPGLTVSP